MISSNGRITYKSKTIAIVMPQITNSVAEMSAKRQLIFCVLKEKTQNCDDLRKVLFFLFTLGIHLCKLTWAQRGNKRTC